MDLVSVVMGVPAMALEEAMLRRLSFIRYMYRLGADQSRQPEPYSAVSILTLHDAVELFLQLAAEQLNVPTKRNTGFMAYWGFLEPKLGNDGLSQKQAMDPPEVQREYAKRAGRVVELSTGHHPMLARPEPLARVLAEAAAAPEG